MRDWAAIRNDLAASADGSRLARDRLRAVLGADHGSDRVAWHELARVILRAEVTSHLTSLGIPGAAIETAIGADERAMYSLDPYSEVRRIAASMKDAALKAAIERAAATLLPRPEIELEDIVPEDRLWQGDGECIDTAADYVDIVNELLSFAGIEASDVTCRDGRADRTLSIKVGRAAFRATLRGDTDYLDEPAVIECLNRIVTSLKMTRRYYQVADPRWGQETGIAYASAAEAKRLRAAGLLVKDEAD